MGRGRAKAKQTKVARELKYSSPTMDLDALQREIGSGTAHGGQGVRLRGRLRRPVRALRGRRRGLAPSVTPGPTRPVRPAPLAENVGVISVTPVAARVPTAPVPSFFRGIVGDGFSAGRGD